MKEFLAQNKSEYSSEVLKACEGFDIVSVKHQSFKECLVLFTSGLSKVNQEVIAGSEAYTNIELFFCLPEYWSLENSPWPLDYLKRLGDYVVAKKSWLGNGHTMPTGNPPESLEEHFKAKAFILMRPDYLKHFFGDDFISKNGFVPLAVVPIFPQELAVKIRTSHTLIFEKFEAKGVDERIDTYRKSALRKKFFGII